MSRPYEDIARQLSTVTGSRADRMRAAVDVLWDALAPTGVSWIGFYLIDRDGAEMTLGPRRDRPACSPIGLHGACGLAWRERRSVVVRDVRELGAGYIACDPRDLSEVVVPLFDAEGGCWGVLDADSFEVGSFDERDAAELARVMRLAGLDEAG